MPDFLTDFTALHVQGDGLIITSLAYYSSKNLRVHKKHIVELEEIDVERQSLKKDNW